MTPSSSGSLRDQVAAVRFYDDRFRHGYMDDWTRDKCARVATLVKQLPLPPVGRALDFGCGTGMFAEVLRDALPGWTIEGTDLSSVALESASRRLPGCSFFPLVECDERRGQYDLVFTHHVLEHVSDLGGTALMLARIAKPASSMLHILPCGNSGSFEHGIALLRTDGVRTEPERLFFFEEEGHLRRLDTDSMATLWSREGFRIDHQWYASHRIGALRARTSFGLGDVLSYANPAMAVDGRARRRLRMLRWAMVALWAVRKPIAVVHNKTRLGCHNVRDYVLLVGSLTVYPVAATVDWGLRYFESREWTTRQLQPAGSEMFIHLIRP